MEDKMNMNFSCISCEKNGFSKNDLWNFDEEFEAGKCRSCLISEKKPQMPSFRKIKMVRSIGDSEKNQELDNQINIYNFCYPKETKYLKKDTAPKNDPSIISQSKIHLYKKMNYYLSKPGYIDYDLVRDVFWSYYQLIIKNSKGLEIEASMIDKHTKFVVKNYILWMIGSNSGEFDPMKSIYLYGDVGVGKSTIAFVGHHVLEFLGSRYKWYPRHYKYVSIPTIWNESNIKSSIDGIENYFKNSFCFDELSEKYMIIKHYREDYNFIRELIYARYDLWNRNKTQTIFTSNITPKRLKVLIDDNAVIDRMRQQYNFVYYEGNSKRK